MELVELTSKQVADLATLFVELWPESNIQEEIEYCRKIVDKNDETTFLLLHNEIHVGFILLKVRHDHVEGSKGDFVAYIEGIYVRPIFQNLGWGKVMIERAVEWAKKMGSKQLASDVEIGNSSSLNFHKRTGFREANRVVCLIKDL